MCNSGADDILPVRGKSLWCFTSKTIIGGVQFCCTDLYTVILLFGTFGRMETISLERQTIPVVRVRASHPQFKIKSMKILLFRKKKERLRQEARFMEAQTRCGFRKEIFEVIRTKDGTVWNIIGVVFLRERRIFVIWEKNGRAYVCHTRERDFDLLLKPL